MIPLDLFTPESVIIILLGAVLGFLLNRISRMKL